MILTITDSNVQFHLGNYTVNIVQILKIGVGEYFRWGVFVEFHKNKIYSLATILLGLILASPVVHAQYPDLTGPSWNGSASGRRRLLAELLNFAGPGAGGRRHGDHNAGQHRLLTEKKYSRPIIILLQLTTHDYQINLV